MDLDQRIAKIQRSTRTAIPYFVPTHNSLRMRFNWYYNWHLSAKSNLIHILILLLFTANAFIGVYDRYIPHSSAAVGTTQWGSSVVSAPGDSGFGEIAKDSAGNIYVAGYTRSSGEYNFGNDVTVSNTNSANPILVKYNPDGLAQWAVTVQSDLSGSSLYYDSIAIDSTGNIYLATSTGGLGVFDFGNGITASGTYQFGTALLVKYSSEGVAQWAKTASGTQKSYFNGVAVDTSGNVYATGAIVGTVPHNFGNGVVIAANGTNNGVIVKYNPAGEVQWAKIAETASSASKFSKVGVDSSGGIFAVGYIYRTGQFDFGNGATVVGPYNGINAVVVKYNADGQAQWARTATEASQESEFINIAIDNMGGIYAVGTITGSTQFSFGDEVSVTASCADDNALIVRYDTNGLAQWAKSTIAGINYSTFDSVASDNNGNIYAAGHIYGGSVFDFGDGTTVTGALGGDSDNAVLLRYTSDGTADWATTPRVASDWSDFYGITADDNGNVYATGEINGTLPFDFGDGVTITGPSSYSGFLVKYNFPTPSSASCSDGIQNQDETGIDCGGSCGACEPDDLPSCSDGILNQDETSTDSGGVCGNSPKCTDSVKNGDETGIDCGGSCGACGEITEPPIIDTPTVDPPVICPLEGESQCQAMAENSYSSCVLAANNNPAAIYACAASSCSAESQCIVACGGSGADQKDDIHLISPSGSSHYKAGDIIEIKWGFTRNTKQVVVRNLPIKMSISTDGGENYRQQKILFPSTSAMATSPLKDFYSAKNPAGRELPAGLSELNKGYLSYSWRIPYDTALISNDVRIKLEPAAPCVPKTESQSDPFGILGKSTDNRPDCQGICSVIDSLIRHYSIMTPGVLGAEEGAGPSLLLMLAAVLSLVIVLANLTSNTISVARHSNILSYFVKGLEKNNSRSVIYDASTSLPLSKAVVILSDIDSNLSANAVSDNDGNFSIPVNPGHKYKLQVNKSRYRLMDNLGAGLADKLDLKYDHNYFGGIITVPTGCYFLNMNLPLSPEVNNDSVQRLNLALNISRALTLLNYLLISVGFFLAFYAVLLSYSTYNWLIFGLYCILIVYLITKRLLLSWQHHGSVADEDGKPVSLAVIRVIELSSNRLVRTVVSDKDGNFGLSLGAGKYTIHAQKAGMYQVSHNELKVGKTTHNIAVKIKMVPDIRKND